MTPNSPTAVAEKPERKIVERVLPQGRIDEDVLRRLREWIPLAGDEVETLEVSSPFSGGVLGQIPLCTEATLDRALGRARRAQKSWAECSAAERAAPFIRYHDLILERREEVLDLIQLETGKARKDAFEEIADVALVARYYAIHAEDHLRRRRRKGALPGLTATWQYQPPRGVVGFIAPWNYPLTLAVTDAIPALLAGNAVILKPDRQTPFTALMGIDLLYEAGLPADLFQVVTGSGSKLGGPLIDRVDYITFTGSTATGRKVAARAGERLIGCSLELGGKNAMIVLEDADLDSAVEGALRGCFSNSGQLCISIERLLIQRPMYDIFANRFARAAADIELGAGLDFQADMGSLASRDQLNRVQLHLQEALGAGARLLAGGRARPDIGPLFFEPTVLAGVTPEMSVYAQETFGPVVALYPFDSEEDAISMANDTPYGLSASVWTGREERGIQMATRLEAGTVNINEAYAAAWASVDAPMGGFKDSGLGRRHGAEGILKYTESQTVAVQRGPAFAPPPGLGEEGYSRLLSGALKALRRIPGLR